MGSKEKKLAEALKRYGEENAPLCPDCGAVLGPLAVWGPTPDDKVYGRECAACGSLHQERFIVEGAIRRNRLALAHYVAYSGVFAVADTLTKKCKCDFGLVMRLLRREFER